MAFDSKYSLNETDMKLDLDVIQQNKDICERTELQIKQDKFAYFDKECSQILDYIYIGSEGVARNRKTLYENGITHVLNCVGFVCPEYFPQDFSYKTLWLQDSPTEDITSILYDVFDYFEEVQEEGGHIFVHCCQGVSRSTSLVIAYLMWIGKYTFEDAFQHVKAARGITNPNMGFACQLLQCQKRMHAIPISPKSTLRMYRMAPHSVYDPMHLVPKKISNNHIAAFDSRGAFIILTPNILFVWQGLQCDANMANAAHHFVGQICRYEKATSHIKHTLENQEPEEFWNVFENKEFHINKIASLQDVTQKKINLMHENNFGLLKKPNPLVKMILLYDKDFETYMKAKCNKLMPVDINKRPQNSNWTHLQRKYINGLERSSLEIKKVLNENILFEGEKVELLEKIKLNDCKETKIRPKFVSSLDASQYSSISSLLFHSILLNSSQLPLTMTSPCVSPPASPTLIVSNTPTPTKFHVDCTTLTSILTSILLNDSVESKSQGTSLNDSLFSKSPRTLRNDSAKVVPNLSIFVNEDASLPNINPQISTISNKNKIMYDPTLLQTNNIGYKRDVSIKAFEQMSNICTQNERVDSSSKACCSFQKEEGESSSTRYRVRQGDDDFVPILYEWPQMEKIDMFDADDLDSNGAFVLLILDIFSKNGRCLYLWVGSSLFIESDQPSTIYNGNIEEQLVEHWQHIGKDLIHQLQLQNDIHIEVILVSYILFIFYLFFHIYMSNLKF